MTLTWNSIFNIFEQCSLLNERRSLMNKGRSLLAKQNFLRLFTIIIYSLLNNLRFSGTK
jgi:hypothetical protein